MSFITFVPSIPAKLGFATYTDFVPRHTTAAVLTTQWAALSESFHDMNVETLGSLPRIQSVRRLFKHCGIDPSRYRPSAEALLRRLIKGQSIPHINAVADINNICSMQWQLPFGSYESAAVLMPIEVRLGNVDETYEGLSKTINASGKLVLVDAEGAFGSPVADSRRTSVSDQTREFLVIIYASEDCPDKDINNALHAHRELAAKAASAKCTNNGIVKNV